MIDLLFRRYLWLIDMIRNAREISYGDIAARWERSSLNDDHSSLSLRTFHNHRNAIEKHFGIEIACHRGRGRNTYYIANRDAIEDDTLNRWMLDSFATGNMLAEHRDITDKILLEDIPGGTEHLPPILKGLRENKRLRLLYRSYRSAASTETVVEPLCVRMFKRRWYLLVHRVKENDLRIYALDRIRELNPTDETFVYPADFHPADYFVCYYGIATDGYSQLATVRLKAYAELPHYLRALPLHTSQREAEHTQDYSIFEYYLSPTFDFVQELLLHGDQIEVLAPADLRVRVAGIIRAMNTRYENFYDMK